MKICGFTLEPDYTKGLDYTVRNRQGKAVGSISFVWGYVKVSRFVYTSNGLDYYEVPIDKYYYWEEDKYESQYPPGGLGIKLIKKCVRRLKVSLFINKFLFKN